MRLRDIKKALDEALPGIQISVLANKHDTSTVLIDKPKKLVLDSLALLAPLPGFQDARDLLNWPELTMTGERIIVSSDRRTGFEGRIANLLNKGSVLSAAIGGVVAEESPGKIAIGLPGDATSLGAVAACIATIRGAVQIVDPDEEATTFAGVEEGSDFFGIQISDPVAQTALLYLFQFAMSWLQYYMLQRQNLANMRHVPPGLQHTLMLTLKEQIEAENRRLAVEYKEKYAQLDASVDQVAHSVKQLASMFAHGSVSIPALNAPRDVQRLSDELRLMQQNVEMIAAATETSEKKHALPPKFQIPDLEPPKAPPRLPPHESEEQDDDDDPNGPR